MKNFIISYITLEGDSSNVFIEAHSREDAKIQLKKEYWDVREILRVREVHEIN